MSEQGTSFNPADARVRVGIEAIPGVEPGTIGADHTFTGEGMANEDNPIESASIFSGSQSGEDSPGALDSNGPMNTEVDSEGHYVYMGNAQGCFATTTPAAGVFSHRMSPDEATPYPDTYTVEIDRRDGMPQLFKWCETQQIVFAAGVGTLLTAEFSVVSELGEYWAKATSKAPLIVPLHVRGNEKQPLWSDLEDPDGDLRIRIKDVTDTDAIEVQVMLGAPILTGSVSVTIATDIVTGTNTRFTKEVQVGDILNILGELIAVLVVTDDTNLQLAANHVAGASVVSCAKEYGPNTSTIVPGLTPKEEPIWNPLVFASDGSNVGEIELETEAFTPDSISFAGLSPAVDPVITLTGTVTVGAGSTAVSGAGTLFLTELAEGDTIRIAGEQHRVRTITSDIALVLHAPHVAGNGLGGPADKDFEWQVAREREEWTQALPDLPPMSNVLMDIVVDGEPEKVQEVTITIARPVVPDAYIGSRRPCGLDESGKRTVTGSIVQRYKKTDMRRRKESKKPFFLLVRATSKEAIALPSTLHHEILMAMPRCVPSGRTASVESGDEIIETTDFKCAPDPGNAEGWDSDITLVLQNSIEFIDLT